MRMNSPVRVVAAIVLVLIISGCAHKRISTGEAPGVLYGRAIKELSKEGGFPYILKGPNYDRILDYLKEIQIRHPYSPYEALAQLRTGDVYFRRGQYGEAIVEYEEFIKRHPGHREIPYAMYRLGLSNFKLRHGVDRDPTKLREATYWFDKFMWNYPHSKYYREVSKLSMRARRLLAEREIYIGNYYREKKKNYRAAAERYNVVVERYYDTNQVEKALYLIGESYYKMGEYAQAIEPLLRVVKEYPEAHYHKKASELLSKIEAASKSKLVKDE